MRLTVASRDFRRVSRGSPADASSSPPRAVRRWDAVQLSIIVPTFNEAPNVADHIGGVVGAVVDEDDLGIDPVDRRRDATDQLRDIRSLIEGRDDDRELHCRPSSHAAEGVKLRECPANRLHCLEQARGHARETPRIHAGE